jgi:hypothetical protein
MGGLGILGGFSGGEVWKLVAGRVPLGCVAASWCSCQDSPHDGIDRVPRLAAVHCRKGEAARTGRIGLKRVRRPLGG